jgi:anti-sigma regulatory factor (Ser/Thr protein kinase)
MTATYGNAPTLASPRWTSYELAGDAVSATLTDGCRPLGRRPEEGGHPESPGGGVDLAAVRRRARAVMAGWGIPQEAADDALVVVSELTTNAVLHALPPVVLRLLRVCGGDGRPVLRIEVTDTGPVNGGPGRTCGPLPEEHGRGLTIVDALSIRTGTRTDAAGVTRWAVLPAA